MAFTAHLSLGRMDEVGGWDSPIHRLDARSKAFTTLAFMVTVMSFPHHELSAVLPFLLYPVLTIAAAGIPPGLILRKLLLAAPFAVFVGLFNPWLDPGRVTLPGGATLSAGWFSFASILLRFALTVAAALALMASTGMYRLCAGMERMGVPRVLVVQLLFLYRYLFVMTDEAQRMWRSLRLRSSGGRAPALRVYGSLVGHLLLRALDRAHRIHGAMLARGFDGTVRTLATPRLRRADVLFAAAWMAFFLAARRWNLARALGDLFLQGAP